ncbi:MAG TPA: hypothetical protein IAC12_09355 [Candidatus Aphodovivens avistercoris]|nr:hypothetical protein [Candidatus Aphodovivens avistercoris]
MIEQELMSFLTVLVVAIVVAGGISTLYALGLRLWAAGAVEVDEGTHLLPRLGSVVCFAACVAIVLFALWLMIPLFH